MRLSGLSPKWRKIFHGKITSHVRTIDRLIDVLWYGSRLREHYSLFLNVISILFFNFNLNHFHTRYTPRTLLELRLLQAFHRGIDRFVRAYARSLTALARLTGKRNPHLVAVGDVL